MSQPDETWQRIVDANKAAGVDVEWSVADRDQIEALADDLNRELERYPVVHAWRTKNGSQLEFWCGFCNGMHAHGRHLGPARVEAIKRWDAEENWVPRSDSVLPLHLWIDHLEQFAGCTYNHLVPGGRGFCTCPAGSGDGHRVAHCWKRDGAYYDRGYILHEVEPNDGRALHKPNRLRK
jgi:hypothetical protein